jgi:hypothetical protein
MRRWVACDVYLCYRHLCLYLDSDHFMKPHHFEKKGLVLISRVSENTLYEAADYTVRISSNSVGSSIGVTNPAILLFSIIHVQYGKFFGVTFYM